ncbi:MAG: hypothetical protein ACW7DR_19665 [Paraglaciecola chathamensis]
MNKPQITEEKLKLLIECLVSKFRAQFGDSRSRLSEKQFYLTDRMGCCKSAGLNFEYRATTDEEARVNVNSSAFVVAVNELAHRGWVEKTGNNLTFCLTEKGYDQGLQENEVCPSLWKRFRVCANEHQGVIALFALILTALGILVAYD